MTNVTVKVTTSNGLLKPLLFMTLFNFNLLTLGCILFVANCHANASLVSRTSRSNVVSVLVRITNVLNTVVINILVTSGVGVGVTLTPIIGNTRVGVRNVLSGIVPNLLDLIL